MTDQTTSTDATQASTEDKTPLTLDERIARVEAQLAKLRQQKLTENLLSNIEKGDKVTIKFGRSDKVRNIEGEVVGVALPNIAVLAADLETYKVHVRDVIANPTAQARTGVADTAEIGADGRRPEEAGSVETVESQLGTDDAAVDVLENEGGPVSDAAADPLDNA